MRFVLLVFLLQSFAYASDVKLALNWKPEPQFGGFYTAQVAGFFAKNNLSVKIQEGGSGTPTIQMLGSEQVDYAIVSADEIIMAHDRGNNQIVALFAVYQMNPQGIMVHASQKIPSIGELLKRKDMTLLWQSGLPYALYLQKKYPQMSIQTAPYSGGISTFQTNEKMAQQCFVTSEPLAAKKAGLKVKSFLIADSGYNPYTTVLATTKKKLKQSPAEVKKMILAVRQGWESYLRNPQATNSHMQKLNAAMDAATFAESAQAQKPLIQTAGTKLGSMTKKRWQQLINQLRDIQVIKSKPKVEDLLF
jgi:NitT/TauT family transport system substrate-binding protein